MLLVTHSYVARSDILNALSTLSQAKRRHDVEEVLKNCEVFIYGDVHYINNSFCKNVLKFATP